MDGTRVPELAPTALKRRLDQGDPLVLLDVREDDEREYCRIDVGAGVVDLHVPLREIPSRAAEIEESARLGPLVVYCHHGVRSMVAATWLSRRGVVGVENLAGGIDAWRLAVDPAIRRY